MSAPSEDSSPSKACTASLRSIERAIVTGANGFIGRRLTTRLLEQGVAVLAICHGEHSIQASRELTVASSSFESAIDVAHALERASKGSPDTWKRAAVFHLAGGRVAESPDPLSANARLNVTPTLLVLDALKKLEPSTFVLASSGEVYGDQPGPFYETLRPKPRSAYAVSKLAAEAVVLNAGELDGHAAICARIGVVYGPGQGNVPMLIPQVMRAGVAKRPFEMSTGEQTRDFVFVDDVVDSLIALSQLDQPDRLIVNIGTGVGTEARVAARMALDAVRSHSELRLGRLPARPREVMDYRLDTSLLVTLIGRAPSTSLQSGLAKTAEWLLGQRDENGQA